MTHRDRVLAALNHRVPDRLPIDLGSARFTGIVKPACENLCGYLGIGAPGPMVDRMQQVVEVEESVLQCLDVDCRSVSLGAPDHGRDVELPGDGFRDEWGVERFRPAGSIYYDMRRSPLEGEIDSQAIARYPWPDPSDPGRFRGLRERALRIRQHTGYALIFNARYHLVHQTQYLRGFNDWFLDLAGNPDRFRCLMDAVLEVLIAMNRPALRAIGDLIDIVAMGDDVGMQDRPICSLNLYRQAIRPYQERIVAAIREHTGAKILYHTCGSVYRYIPDFIDIGIDALNPVQVSAKNMEPERLKREFGDRIAFWGGMDSQHLLPRGTPEEIRAGVRRMFRAMGENGGYVLAAVHNIQPDVAPENIVAMFAEARQCRYPAQPSAVPASLPPSQ